MKRTKPTTTAPRTPSDKPVDDLLRRLRELDEESLEEVSGGICGSRCGARCRLAQN